MKYLIFTLCIIIAFTQSFADYTCQDDKNYIYKTIPCESSIILENLKINNVREFQSTELLQTKIKNAFKNAITVTNFATYYEKNIVNLSDEQKVNIQSFLNSTKPTSVEIRGYASSDGAEDYNQKMSNLRAAAVEAFINEINPAVVTSSKGYGKLDSMPRSRRAEIIIK